MRHAVQLHASLAREAAGNRGMYAKSALKEKDNRALFLLLNEKPRREVERAIVARMSKQAEQSAACHR